MSRVPTLTTVEETIDSRFDGTAADIETGDFNGDGLTDVVITKMIYPFRQFSVDTEILLNDGQGGLVNGTEAMLAGDQAWTMFGQEIEVADFNGDGVDDIFVADQGFIGRDGNLPGNLNLLLLSDGSGGMVNATAQALPLFYDVSTSATSGDVDGDGDIDLFVGNTWGNNKIPPYLLLNDGNGNFDYSNDRLPADVLDVDLRQYTDTELVDMDGDGDLDLVMGAGAQYQNPNLILMNDGSGSFKTKVTLPDKPFSNYGIVQDLAVGDLNGDGLNDLVINYTDPSRQGNATQIVLQTSTGTFVDATQTHWPSFVESGPPAAKVTLVDLDDDGDLDIALEMENTGIRYYSNNGTGAFTPRQLDLDGGDKFVIADINGDRSPDIVSTIERSNKSAEYQIQLNEHWPSVIEGEDGGTTITITDQDGSRVTGGDGDDTVHGGPGPDSVAGGDGDDTLNGAGGPDTLQGQNGNDTLNGGAGGDRLDGGNGGDTADYDGSPGGVSVDLSTGQTGGGDAEGDRLADIEHVSGSDHADTLTGDDGENTLSGKGGDDTLAGGDGDDTLDGGAGDDTLNGEDGNDTLTGGPGADALDGGAWWDAISYRLSDEGVTVSLADGTAEGGDAEGDTITNVEEIIGSAHDDRLTGNDESNRLQGGDGDDTLDGRGGSDHLVGGPGRDTADYGTATDDLVIDMTRNRGGLTVQRPDGDDLLEGIEGVIGGSGDDRLTGDTEENLLVGGPGQDTLHGREADDILRGGPGDDALHGGSGNDTADFSDGSGATVDLSEDRPTGSASGVGTDTLASIENVIGTATADSLTGDHRDNVLIGGGGDDRLRGNDGDDPLDGGSGADRIDGGDGNDTVGAGDGADTVSGGDGNDTIDGDDGDDILAGDGGDDTIDGGAGVDTISGGDGDDTLIGGDGEDELTGGRGNDVLRGGVGSDRLLGNQGDDSLIGGAGADHLGGGAGNDSLDGGDEDDRLIGYTGDDTLSGGRGDDVLDGGEGSDSLTGGAGQDTFYFARSGGGIDRIVDFSIDDADIIRITGTGLDTWSELREAYAVTMQAGDLRIEFDTGNILILEGVTDQDVGSTDFEIS